MRRTIMNNKPLSGVRVIEMGTFVAAPTTARFLADLGADVIKIESEKGDPIRFTASTEGRPVDNFENTTWDLENANKRSISLDLKAPEGKGTILRLLDKADIFITNWRPQALERAGLDYETIKERYPSLVYAMCTGYGEFGPDKDLPGFDFTAYFARGGYLEGMRQKDSIPMNVIPGVGDHNVGMNLAAGVLAALYQAKASGRGEKVTTSLFQSAVFNMGIMVQAAQYKDIGKPYPINVWEGDNPLNAPWHTKDGRYIQTCLAMYDAYYKKFVTAIGRADLADSDKYFPIEKVMSTGVGPEIYSLVAEAINKMTVKECTIKLKEADIPFSLAQTLEEILEDQQAWANECFYSMKYQNGNTRTLARPPVNFAEMGEPDYKCGPQLGENGEEILREIGYTKQEINNLIDNKVLFITE